MQRREKPTSDILDAWGSETLLPTCYAWNADRKQSSSASKNKHFIFGDQIEIF